jgi:hypothetical protein
VPPGYRRQEAVTRPKLDAFVGVIDAIVEEDKTRPAKQRHTAKRVFDRLREEHQFTGGYTIVKDYLRSATQREREMFVPLTHPSGEAQADFGEALVVIGGVECKAHYLVVDLPHSDDCFVIAFPAETTEAFLEGPVKAFAYFSKLRAGSVSSASCVGTRRPSPSALSATARHCYLCLHRLMTPARRLQRESAPWRWCAIAATTTRWPTRHGHLKVLVRGYVYEVTITCGSEVIAKHARSYEREAMVYDPLHYLALLEQKTRALDQAAPLQGWQLPACFATLRRLLEARLKHGGREDVQVLRLLETFKLDELTRAIEDALELGTIGFDAVKHLLLCRIEQRPPRLDMENDPHLPLAQVRTTQAADYMTLLGGATA